MGLKCYLLKDGFLEVDNPDVDIYSGIFKSVLPSTIA